MFFLSAKMLLLVVNEYASFAGHCMSLSDLQNDPHKLWSTGHFDPYILNVATTLLKVYCEMYVRLSAQVGTFQDLGSCLHHGVTSFRVSGLLWQEVR